MWSSTRGVSPAEQRPSMIDQASCLAPGTESVLSPMMLGDDEQSLLIRGMQCYRCSRSCLEGCRAAASALVDATLPLSPLLPLGMQCCCCSRCCLGGCSAVAVPTAAGGFRCCYMGAKHASWLAAAAMLLLEYGHPLGHCITPSYPQIGTGAHTCGHVFGISLLGCVVRGHLIFGSN